MNNSSPNSQINTTWLSLFKGGYVCYCSGGWTSVNVPGTAPALHSHNMPTSTATNVVFLLSLKHGTIKSNLTRPPIQLENKTKTGLIRPILPVKNGTGNVSEKFQNSQKRRRDCDNCKRGGKERWYELRKRRTEKRHVAATGGKSETDEKRKGGEGRGGQLLIANC